MADRLSALLQRFELRARVFHGGALCGVSHFEERHGTGHLHLLRQGTLAVTDARATVMVVDEPSVLFLARPMAHRLEARDPAGAELVCATVDFGTARATSWAVVMSPSCGPATASTPSRLHPDLR